MIRVGTGKRSTYFNPKASKKLNESKAAAPHGLLPHKHNKTQQHIVQSKVISRLAPSSLLHLSFRSSSVRCETGMWCSLALTPLALLSSLSSWPCPACHSYELEGCVTSLCCVWTLRLLPVSSVMFVVLCGFLID